jgi:NTE family protein
MITDDFGSCLSGPAFAGLDAGDVAAILGSARGLAVRAGEYVFRQGDPGDRMYVIREGRVRVLLDEGTADEMELGMLSRGEHFGELSMLIGSPRNAAVKAVVDTDLLVIDQADFQRAIQMVPRFAVNLGRTIGHWLRGELHGDRERTMRSVFAVVSPRPEHASLAQQMIACWERQGSIIRVVSSRPERWPERLLLGGLTDPAAAPATRDRITAAGAAGQRVLIDAATAADLNDVVGRCEQLLWVLDGSDPTVDGGLAGLLDREPMLAERVHVVQAIRERDRLPPSVPHGLPTLAADLKAVWRETASGPQFRELDVGRCVHRVDGVCFGLALGGGGAKGMAHLGVLETLEREGIHFDLVAGTSAGAIMAAGYAMGMPTQRMLDLLTREMSPPAWLRRLPRSRELYLLSQFRSGWIEPKFRRHLGTVRFEDLLLPASLVTVDLITGQERVRRSGDVVQSIMESINHPIFGRPILRGGEALVDGGVLANVPAHTLKRQGATFVVAVDVTLRLSTTFAADPRRPGRLRPPGYLQTLLRVNDVTMRSLTGIHRSGSDLLIAPDTSAFSFDDFTRGVELIERGREAAEAALPNLREQIAAHSGLPG